MKEVGIQLAWSKRIKQDKPQKNEIRRSYEDRGRGKVSICQILKPIPGEEAEGILSR